MAVGDLYEASIRQEIDGEELYNIFHLEQLTTVGTVSDIATRIINQWISENWETLVALGLSFIEITVRNLFDAQQQTTVPIGTVGDLTGDMMPPHDAMQATLNTFSPVTTGSKRFGGLVEGSQDTGRWLTATNTLWDTFINDTLATPITSAGPTLLYQYVIVKRIPYTTPSGNPAYRLPENSGEATFYQVNSGFSENVVRTQRSRDYKE